MLAILGSPSILTGVCLLGLAALLRLETNRVARTHEPAHLGQTDEAVDELPELKSA